MRVPVCSPSLSPSHAQRLVLSLEVASVQIQQEQILSRSLQRVLRACRTLPWLPFPFEAHGGPDEKGGGAPFAGVGREGSAIGLAVAVQKVAELGFDPKTKPILVLFSFHKPRFPNESQSWVGMPHA